MTSAQARKNIHKIMDAQAILLDARDNFKQIQKGITGYIDKINKSIADGKEANQELEVLTKHAA